MTATIITNPPKATSSYFFLFEAAIRNSYNKKTPPKVDRYHLAHRMAPSGATKSLCGLVTICNMQKNDAWFFISYRDVVKFDRYLTRLICKRCRQRLL